MDVAESFNTYLFTSITTDSSATFFKSMMDEPEFDIAFNYRGITYLMEAALHCRVDLLELLFDRGAEVDPDDYHSEEYNLIANALQPENSHEIRVLETVKYLTEHGVMYGRDLEMAVGTGRSFVTGYFLSQYEQVSTERLKNLLVLSAEHGSIACYRLLSAVRPSIVDFDANLLSAVEEGHFEIPQYILSSGLASRAGYKAAIRKATTPGESTEHLPRFLVRWGFEHYSGAALEP